MQARWLLAPIAALVLVACGGSDKKYQIPVDTPARPFQPPEAEDLVESDDGWSLDEPVDEGEGGDAAEPAEDEGGEAEGEPPAATEPKPTPDTATPPVTPTKPKKKSG